MKESRYSEDWMVRILREADHTSVAAAAKKHGVSEQSIRESKQRGCMVSDDDGATAKRRAQKKRDSARKQVKRLARRAAFDGRLRPKDRGKLEQLIGSDPELRALCEETIRAVQARAVKGTFYVKREDDSQLSSEERARQQRRQRAGFDEGAKTGGSNVSRVSGRSRPR